MGGNCCHPPSPPLPHHNPPYQCFSAWRATGPRSPGCRGAEAALAPTCGTSERHVCDSQGNKEVGRYWNCWARLDQMVKGPISAGMVLSVEIWLENLPCNLEVLPVSPSCFSLIARSAWLKPFDDNEPGLQLGPGLHLCGGGWEVVGEGRGIGPAWTGHLIRSVLVPGRVGCFYTCPTDEKTGAGGGSVSVAFF